MESYEIEPREYRKLLMIRDLSYMLCDMKLRVDEVEREKKSLEEEHREIIEKLRERLLNKKNMKIVDVKKIVDRIIRENEIRREVWRRQD